MNGTFFKAVRPDGTDFHTGKVRWLPAEGVIPAEGWVVEHPASERVGDDASSYLSVSTVVTDCSGMRWPCRLLRVVPDGSQVRIPDPVALPNTRAAHSWRVIEELPAWKALGPQGREIETLLGQAKSLTGGQALEMCSAWDAAWSDAWDADRPAARPAAWDAARSDAWDAARPAARDAAWGAAWDAARPAAWRAAREAVREAVRGAAWDAVWEAIHGLLILDLDPDAAEMLLAPWVSVMGRSWEVTT